MDESDEWVVIGVLELAEAKRLRSVLETQQRVVVRLFSNPETCQTGSCSAKVEVQVSADDVIKVKALLSAERSRLLEGLDVDLSLLDEVYDSEKGAAKCPACGEEFSTQLAECPECGLGFGPG